LAWAKPVEAVAAKETIGTILKNSRRVVTGMLQNKGQARRSLALAF